MPCHFMLCSGSYVVSVAVSARELPSVSWIVYEGEDYAFVSCCLRLDLYDDDYFFFFWSSVLGLVSFESLLTI
jgi:hypothetical protein